MPGTVVARFVNSCRRHRAEFRLIHLWLFANMAALIVREGQFLQGWLYLYRSDKWSIRGLYTLTCVLSTCQVRIHTQL